MILLWLTEALALKGLAKGLVRWVLRLCLLGLLIGLAAGIVWYKPLQEWLRAWAIPIAALWLLWVALRWSWRRGTLVKWMLRLLLLVVVVVFCARAPRGLAIALAVFALAGFAFQWWRHREGEADAGERTIDGKVVPEKLAIAALDIPLRSPDGDYVLRGLPDYGKALLKLNSKDFEYVPEIPEERSELPLEKPAVRTFALAMQRLALRLLLLAILGLALSTLRILRGETFAEDIATPWLLFELVYQWSLRRRKPAAKLPSKEPPVGGWLTALRWEMAAGAVLILLLGFNVYRWNMRRQPIDWTYDKKVESEKLFSDYLQRAESGDAEAEYRLATMYEYDWQLLEIPKENAQTESQRLLYLAAAQGYIKAELEVGSNCEGGDDGFPKDLDKAALWFRKVVASAPAGSKDSQDAQEALNDIQELKERRGETAVEAKDSSNVAVPPPPPQGERLQTASAGNTAKQVPDTETLMALGIQHLNAARAAAASGHSASEDLNQALHAYFTAADRRNPEAQFMLALIYSDGFPSLKIPPDSVMVVTMLNEAAAQHYLPAEFFLAQCYEIPCNGFQQSEADALSWYSKVVEGAPHDTSAANQMGVKAAERIMDLEEKMEGKGTPQTN